MNTALDNAWTATAAAEATYTADLGNVAQIQAAIDAATAPLAPAEAQLATDKTAFNDSLDALSKAVLAAKIP